MIEAAWHAGFTPCYDHIIGNELLVKTMPVMVDVQMRGWEPVPACKGTGDVKRTRYGQGFGGAIVFTNPEKKDISTRETVFNEYIGEFDTLPVAYDGSSLDFEVANGKTSFNLDLGPRQTAIIEVPVGIRLSGDGAATLTGSSSGVLSADRRTYQFNIESPDNLAADLLIQEPDEFELSEVRVNGKLAYHPVASDDTRNIRINLARGGNSLEVVFVSRVFKSPEEDFLDFVFTDGTESKAVIIVPDEEHERERAAAQMIQDYFFHYLSSQDGRAFTSLIKGVPWVKRSSEVSDWTNSVVIGSCSEGSHGERGIRLDKVQNTLYISGRDPFDTQQLTAKLLRLLDKKYPYFGKLPEFWSVEETREMMKKGGLSGKGFPMGE